MTFKEQVLQIIKKHEKEYNPVDDYVTTNELAWLYEEIRSLDDNPWHTGKPTEEGEYICAFLMSDESVEYGWCCWDGTGWGILCDYDPKDSPIAIVGWWKITPFEANTDSEGEKKI